MHWRRNAHNASVLGRIPSCTCIYVEHHQSSRTAQVRVLSESVVRTALERRPPARGGTTAPPAVAAIMGDFNSAAGSALYRCDITHSNSSLYRAQIQTRMLHV